jgi:hypothetical protein
MSEIILLLIVLIYNYSYSKLQNQFPPLFIGVFGRLFLKAPTFYYGLNTWNEHVKSSSILIIAPLLLNYPQ